jgi:hypothetical protein
MLCGQCGTENPDASRSCSQCGQPLGVAPPPLPQPELAAEPSPPVVPRTSGKAIASLIFGVFGLFFGLLFSPAAIAAVVLGHKAKAAIYRSDDRMRGNGLATAGMALGCLGVVAILVQLIGMDYGVLMPVLRYGVFYPNYVQEVAGADEASAIYTLHVYRAPIEEYSVHYPEVGYPSSFVALGPPGGNSNYNSLAAGLVPSDLGVAVPHKNGYKFTLNSSGTAYTINANPDPGIKGVRHFFMDESGTIRANTNGPATANDNPI